ncbi:hypothetical protein EW146_g7171 [Bondarzewia mesenterica]|uniref:F-box domain-containing protein n=1 Tax=Bondarzewia mesenterica TaxID=1095465 RepID=A0A4S4LS68_9AGAM|nr:hypothetical protein EW146_g7171 [Bondarzewia mesenterica]
MITYPEPILRPEIWGNLPVELVREIFVALAMADRTDAKALCLVSKSIRRLVLPFLYHTILLRNTEQVVAFAAPFLPRRPPPFPLSSSPSSSRPVASFPVYSLALAVPAKRPSIEHALDSVAGAFTKVLNLAITAPLLGAHAFWLRKHDIRPTTFMLYHHGLPKPINFREAYFSQVTHLHTSTLSGFHSSSLRDLPALTHVALMIRATQQESVMFEIICIMQDLLVDCRKIEMIVLSLDLPAPRGQEAECYDLTRWNMVLRFASLNQRFFLLPYTRRARLEWHDIASNRSDVFSRAWEWRAIEEEQDVRLKEMKKNKVWERVYMEEEAFVKWSDEYEWDLDLKQAPGYAHQKSDADWGDTDTRE